MNREVKRLKKFIICSVLILTSFVAYFLQSNFFNWFNIAGVMPNLFVILVLFIGLFGNKSMGTIFGIGIGLILDYLFKSKVGIYALSLGMIGFLATIFDKNFSKDSRMTIMFMVLGSTVLFEIVVYFLNYIVFSTNVEILGFLKILLVEVIFNIFITIIVYPLMQRFGYYIENEFKGNKILTRYF